jgi:DNA processing protein
MEKEIVIIDQDSDWYPERLRDIGNAPKRLYCMGNLALLQEQCVAVVGSRRYSLYGQQTALMIGRHLGRSGIVTVSGLANGIDTFAHEGALEEAGKVIAVLGTGFGRIYPQRNRPLFRRIASEGLVMTEYEPEFPGSKYSFPARNRILSGICESVVVVEAGIGSGSLITAQFANEQGRNVYAVPGNINSQFSMGTNLLIRDGAIPLVVMDDLLQDLGVKPVQFRPETMRLGEDEAEIIAIVERNDGIHVNELAHILNKNIGKVSAIITVLEIKGALVSFGGKLHLAK